jgi:YaiO family outer membrane protein
MNMEIQNLLKQSRQGNIKNRIILEHTYEFFKEPYVRRWHVTSLQYQNDAKWGTFIAKANAGQLVPASGELFNPGAMQYEADIYPQFGRGFYAYLNYGYSEEDLFPEHRGGLELYKSFSHGYEISAGGRYLYFKKDNDVLIYTASLSKYFNSWWLSARPYLSELNDTWFQSYFLFFRKYSGPYNYLGGLLGYGISPDLLPDSKGIYEVYNLQSYQFRLDIQHRLATHFLFRTLAGYAYDQYTKDEFRNRVNVQIYLAVIF